MPDPKQVIVYEDESRVEVRLLSDPTEEDSEPRKWKPNTVYTIAIDDGAIIDGAGNQARFNVAPPSSPSTGRRKLEDSDATKAASVTSPSFRTVNGRRRKLAASTTIAQPPARALGYTTGCSEGPTLVGLTSVVNGTSVVVTARFTSSSALTPKADQKIVVLNNATRGLANMFAPNVNFVTYPAMTATPAPTNDYSVVFSLPPLEGPATYVFTPPSIHTELAASVQHLNSHLPSHLSSRLSPLLPHFSDHSSPHRSLHTALCAPLFTPRFTPHVCLPPKRPRHANTVSLRTSCHSAKVHTCHPHGPPYRSSPHLPAGTGAAHISSHLPPRPSSQVRDGMGLGHLGRL